MVLWMGGNTYRLSFAGRVSATGARGVGRIRCGNGLLPSAFLAAQPRVARAQPLGRFLGGRGLRLSEDATELAVSAHADAMAARGRGRRWWFRRPRPAAASAPHDLDVRVVPAPADVQGLADQTPPTSDEVLVGICYGYRARRGQWWFDRVSAGARSAGTPLPEKMAELTELHVLPALHGHRVGWALLQSFLTTRAESSVLLSTPEVEGETNNAWRLYRRAGFSDVLRDFLFEGDPRRFAILRTDLARAAASSAAAGMGAE